MSLPGALPDVGPVGDTCKTDCKNALVKCATQGIKAAKKAGYVPYEQGELMKFIETVDKAYALNFLHEVNF